MAELHALSHEVSAFICDDISYFWYHNNVLLAHGNIIKFLWYHVCVSRLW